MSRLQASRVDIKPNRQQSLMMGLALHYAAAALHEARQLPGQSDTCAGLLLMSKDRRGNPADVLTGPFQMVASNVWVPTTGMLRTTMAPFADDSFIKSPSADTPP